MKNYKINWRKILIAVMLILLACLLVGCVMEDGKAEPKHEELFEESPSEPSGWKEGLFYNNRGKDTTIHGEPYFRYQFNKKTETYDTVWYQSETYRFWEHKYTPGGMREDIWYWDEKSGTWYVFNRSGDYYVFEWRAKNFSLNNYVKN